MQSGTNKLYEGLLIRPNERRAVQYFAFVFFLVGCGLSLGRGSVDVLFLKRYGIEFLPILFSINGLVLILVFLIYTAVVDQISSNKLLTRFLYLTSTTLLVCWLVMARHVTDTIYPVYYVVYEIVSEVLLLHLSMYVTQNFSTQQVKRLLPLVFAGSQAGFIVGGVLLALLSPVLDIHHTLLIWFGCFVLAASLVNRYHQKNGASPYFRPGRKSQNLLGEAVSHLREGIAYATRSALLTTMGFAFFFMVISFYVLTYTGNKIFTEAFALESELAAFLGLLLAVNAALALVLQLVASNRVMRRFGVQKVNLIFPFALCISYLGLLGWFVLPMAAFAYFARDVIMPVFRNPVQSIFYTAFPRQVQGRIRAVSVGLILPFALIASGLVLYGLQSLQWDIGLVIAGLVFSLGFLISNYKMNRAYAPTLIANLRQKVYVPDRSIFTASDKHSETLEMLKKGVMLDDEEIRFAACKTLVRVLGRESLSLVLPVVRSFSPPYQDRLMVLLFDYIDTNHQRLLEELHLQGDVHLQATIVRHQFRRYGASMLDEINAAMNSTNPRMVATGVYGALINDLHSLRDQAKHAWFELLYADNPGEILSGLELVIRLNGVEHLERLFELTLHPDRRVQRQAARAISQMPLENDKKIAAIVKRLLSSDDARARQIAARIATQLDWEQRYQLLLGKLCDPHPDVRRESAVSLFHRGFSAASLVAWLKSTPLPPRALESIVDVIMQKEPKTDEYKQLYRWAVSKTKAYAEMHEAIIQQLKTHDDYRSLLPVLLNERCEDMLLLSLRIAGFVEDVNLVESVIAGINSKSRDVIESAMETLLEFRDKPSANSLIDSVGRIYDISEKIHSRDTWTLDKMKQQCSPLSDPWMWGCLNSFNPGQDSGERYA
ncbi:MAG: MFS transporter [Gammaproteobacteria bacterium]|nr:MFS transporter [Gammaproteobacteria bacterium]